MKFPKWLFALFAATVFATAQAETAPTLWSRPSLPTSPMFSRVIPACWVMPPSSGT